MAIILDPANSLVVRVGDDLPRWTQVLKEIDGTPVAIPSGASADFSMGRIQEDASGIGGPCAIDDAPTGRVGYDWLPGDTDVPGFYRAYVAVTYADGTRRTFPTTGAYVVVIEDTPPPVPPALP